MNVATGTRLGPYEVVSRIGAGGMGEVWKARDTRLDRSVAVKVLPAEFATRPTHKAPRTNGERRGLLQSLDDLTMTIETDVMASVTKTSHLDLAGATNAAKHLLSASASTTVSPAAQTTLFVNHRGLNHA